MARIDSFLRLVVEQQASDLHLDAGSVPVIRHDGDLVRLPFRVLSDIEARRFLLEILSPEQRAAFERDLELDFAYTLEGVGRFRANLFTQANGIGSVFRIIPNRLPTLDELGLPPAARRLTLLQNGLVLVTGPTGSGKTTTLAALVHEINRTSERHIVTLEDPVEFLHAPLRGVVTQRQVGLHVDSFASALRSALREAPDVVVVGELRDLDTISLALSAAETGVLVIGTLHTNSAAKAVDRIVDASPEESRDQVRGVISVLLKGVLAQHLVKRASGEGRLAVVEVLLSSFAVAHLIRENKVHQIDGYLQSSEHAGTGMQSLDSCILSYLKDGLITLDEGLRVANDPETVRRLAAELPEEA